MNKQNLVPLVICFYFSIGATLLVTQSSEEEFFCGFDEPEEYTVLGQSYSNKDLVYKISKYSTRLSRSDVKDIIANAFQAWSNVTDLTFTRKHKAQNGTADIDIRFEIGAHGHGHGNDKAFDGRGKKLAHAAYGYVHFDDSEHWSKSVNSGVTNLHAVAVHEIGHALGLHHSNVKDAIMFRSYNPYNVVVQLHSDDIEGIQSLYGVNTKDDDDSEDESEKDDSSDEIDPTEAPIPRTTAPTRAPILRTTAPTRAIPRTTAPIEAIPFTTESSLPFDPVALRGSYGPNPSSVAAPPRGPFPLSGPFPPSGSSSSSGYYWSSSSRSSSSSSGPRITETFSSGPRITETYSSGPRITETFSSGPRITETYSSGPRITGYSSGPRITGYSSGPRIGGYSSGHRITGYSSGPIITETYSSGPRISGNYYSSGPQVSETYFSSSGGPQMFPQSDPFDNFNHFNNFK